MVRALAGDSTITSLCGTGTAVSFAERGLTRQQGSADFPKQRSQRPANGYSAVGSPVESVAGVGARATVRDVEVVPVAGDQMIVAAEAQHDVVATAAVEVVHPSVADDAVGVPPTTDVLEVVERHLDATADGQQELLVEVDLEPMVVPDQCDRIGAGTAVVPAAGGLRKVLRE